MTKRPLGDSGLETAPLVLGGNVFGWTADEKTSFALLDAFTDTGGNVVDTADIYSYWAEGNEGGESERIIGRWLKRSGRRDRVVLATKVGKKMGPGREGLSRRWILQAVEDSLRRLQTDRIDLYFSHTDDPETPLEETLATYAELLEQGKVRAVGASNHSASRLAEALRVADRHGLPRYRVLQPEYNLYARQGYEEELEPLCAREGLGVVTYFSLASGFLTGKYASRKDAEGRARGSFVKKYFDERGERILAALERTARELDAAPAQLALAWLMARPSVTAPIASATSLGQLEDLLAAARIELPSWAIRELEEASHWRQGE